jgi:hypothetical protein
MSSDVLYSTRGIRPKDPELRLRIVTAARAVVTRGAKFEENLVKKQMGNSNYAFLFEGNSGHSYFAGLCFESISLFVYEINYVLICLFNYLFIC